MAKHKNQTHAAKPSTGVERDLNGETGTLDPGTVKGAGGDISGKHPPEYGEIDRDATYEEREDDETE